MKPLEALQRWEAVRAADQAVQLHPQLPRGAVRPSGRRRSRTVPPYRAVRKRPAQMGAAAVDRPVFEGSAIGSVPRFRARRDSSRASRATATCSKSTSSTKRRSAPMQAVRRAEAKRRPAGPAPRPIEELHFIGKESNKLEEVEEQSSRTPLTFIPNIPIRGATNGKRRFCRFSGGHPLRLLLTQRESAVAPFRESETNRRSQQQSTGVHWKRLQKVGSATSRSA